VPLWMAGADAAVELKRAESDKEESRENVDQREDWVMGEDIIGGCELSEDGIPGCGWGVIAVEHDGDEMDSTARDDCNADYDQEDRRGPEELVEAPHTDDTQWDERFFREVDGGGGRSRRDVGWGDRVGVRGNREESLAQSSG